MRTRISSLLSDIQDEGKEVIDVQAVVSLCYLSSQGYFILTINENKSKTVMTEPAKKCLNVS